MPEHGSGFLVWAGALLAGGVLGAVFFGGLWWTVRHATSSPTPARWFLGSLVLRTAFVLAGFYAVGAGQPALMGLCLLGFLLARAIVLRATKPVPDAATTSGVPPCA
ncbi:MAG: ATP synthase subunit I [Gammaproteobacteria bacterium]|uniref:ATP synthase subunit I n=1 Tax=Hydrogenophaga sp. TaxID=1904254 RepID=UPI0025BCBC17|nr:ATP synthase subunit I [Hydrogenophaga sp.]MBU4183551.1 ATP synthase subunit I [Gammaproteobacteria bacterium]MBU4280615.1 ATP synthase subunit I [Gammaproteobacteria bacterium]MBU4325982.1 ATP synthase subunit I [Gammaproteobacteria bacterium]MBU4505872.1 ATP synthase subunit I [Gammaproteobacteria bacterium]MCG2656945.1 ATP synthase subunit I [Hydrogenophaga sp.]